MKVRKLTAAVAVFVLMALASAAYAQEPGIVVKAGPGGMAVVAQEYRGDLASASVFVRVGSANETPSNNGITSLLDRTILSCHPAGDAKPATLRIEQLGGRVSFETQSEFTCFTLVAPVRNFGAALKVLAEAVLKPECPEASIMTEKEALYAAVDRCEDNPAEKAYRLFVEKAYDGSPFALCPDGDRAAVGRLSGKDLLSWHRKYYTADNMVLSLCGKFDQQAALKMADEAFGGIARTGPGGERSCPQLQSRPQAGPLKIEEAARSGPAVLIGYDAPGMASPDYPAMRLVEAALCGGMGSSIYRGLREEQGLAYSFGSAMPPMRANSRLVFYVSADQDRMDAAVAAVTRAVDLLRAGSIMPEEVERAKGFAAGLDGMTQESARDRAWYAGLYETLGLGADFGTRLERQMDGLGKGDMVAAANKYMDKFTLVVLKSGKGGKY